MHVSTDAAQVCEWNEKQRNFKFETCKIDISHSMQNECGYKLREKGENGR